MEFRLLIIIHYEEEVGSFSVSMKFKAALLMQYLRPVGAGPSGNTWPRWAWQREQRTSVLVIHSDLSVFRVMLSSPPVSVVLCVS